MLHIDATQFGEITINGKKYDYDIVILPDETILKRKKRRGSHEICLEEFDEILRQEPKIIVVGNGQGGVAKIEERAIKAIRARGIRLIIEITPKAIEIFNSLKEKKLEFFT
ncbi:MAG: MTH938/NDUFAF3 family protein [Candidatus Pacearchaeota archaeon]